MSLESHDDAIVNGIKLFNGEICNLRGSQKIIHGLVGNVLSKFGLAEELPSGAFFTSSSLLFCFLSFKNLKVLKVQFMYN